MHLDMKFYQCDQIICPRPPQKRVNPIMRFGALPDDIGESARWRSSRMGEPPCESKHGSGKPWEQQGRPKAASVAVGGVAVEVRVGGVWGIWKKTPARPLCISENDLGRRLRSVKPETLHPPEIPAQRVRISGPQLHLAKR